MGKKKKKVFFFFCARRRRRRRKQTRRGHKRKKKTLFPRNWKKPKQALLIIVPFRKLLGELAHGLERLDVGLGCFLLENS